MRSREFGSGLLAEAVELLREADRMHRHFFTLAPARSGTCWEPPIDIVESERAILVRVALPGVASDAVEVTTNGTQLRVIGVRPMDAARGVVIHRLEIPFGRFERLVDLPSGRYELASRQMVDGCLVLTLHRIAG
jgi:HSP20 family molecular chaperone IbpA